MSHKNTIAYDLRRYAEVRKKFIEREIVIQNNALPDRIRQEQVIWAFIRHEGRVNK